MSAAQHLRDGSSRVKRRGGERASVLIIILWIAFGLVSVSLYFAHSMSLELRATDNRAAGAEADQAIGGAVRYLTNMLITLQAPGSLPDTNAYQYMNVPVGDAAFWLIGRGDDQTPPDQAAFGLVDEASKLNLNTATLAMLQNLPRMTPELAAAIIDWRDADSTVTTGGAEDETYARLTPAYKCKNAPFESIDELRLVYGMDLDVLYGEDVNMNGVLDANENDGDTSMPADNRDGILDAGILNYVTVYSREPNTDTNGAARVDISSLTAAKIRPLLQTNFPAARVPQILANLGLGGGGGGPGGGGAATVPFASPLRFYIRSKMTADEFALIGNLLTVTNGTYIQGRVNVRTASATVLACLPGCDAAAAQQLISYRRSNPNQLNSIAWVADALSSNTAALQALPAGDYITTLSYQFMADVAAVGHFGRGYRRVKFIVDTADGAPIIRYRQELTRLGWALGKQAREKLMMAKATQ